MSFDESSFGETWSDFLESAIDDSDYLDAEISDTLLEQDWAASDAISNQLRMVARIIKSNRQSIHNERDAFYVRLGGFDTHVRATTKKAYIQSMLAPVALLCEE